MLRDTIFYKTKQRKNKQTDLCSVMKHLCCGFSCGAMDAFGSFVKVNFSFCLVQILPFLHRGNFLVHP